MTDLITDVTNYLAALPSHVRERQAAKLLVRCRDELAKQAERIAAIRKGETSADQMLRENPIAMYDAAMELLRESEEQAGELQKRIAELKTIADQWPEINLANYDEDDVSANTAWGLEICNAVDQLSGEKP